MQLEAKATREKKTITFVFFFLIFAGVAFLLPNMVLYYQSLGLNGIQIGIIVGITPLITLVGAPLWTGLADKTLRHKLVMSMVLLATVITATIFPMARALPYVILMVFLFSIFNAPIPAFADSGTMSMLGGEKELYGRVRLGGTIGFGLAAILSSFILQSYGIHWAFWGYAMMMFLAFIVSQKFTFGKRDTDQSPKWNIRSVLTSRNWIFFLTLAFLGGVAFTTINNYLFTYMRELGANRMTMGLALIISTLGELPVLFFSKSLLKRYKAYSLFLVGISVTGLRLILYAVFNFTAGILLFQVLNGMTFPLMWVSGVAYADQNSPVGMKSTAQGLFGAMVLGIGAAVGGLTGGILMENIGAQWMYFIFGGFVLVSVFIITLLERKGRQR